MNSIAQYLNKLEERKLVRSFLKKRDEQAFRSLYRKYTPGVYRLALRLLNGDEALAEETVQEGWTRAVQNLPKFRWQSSFRTWLHSIIVHCCQEQFRRKNRKNCDIDELIGDSDEPAELHGDSIDLENAFNQLPDGYRQVLILHDLEGYTHKEIGLLLGVQPGTSKSQLSQARKAMRRYLRPETAGEAGDFYD